MSLELETINKLYLELSQIATAKTAKELKLENQILSNEDVITLGRLFLYRYDSGWAKLSSGLHQDFQGGLSHFNIKHTNGSEFKVSFKIEEV